MSISSAKKILLFAALIGAVLIVYSLNFIAPEDAEQSRKMLAMENRIKNLEVLLAKKEEDLKSSRLFALRQNSKNGLAAANTVTEICKQVKQEQNEQGGGGQIVTDIASSSIQVLKDLGTNSVNDPRSFPEKVNDLLAGDATTEKIAIVSKGIFDMAGDRESLPDYALQSLYNNQTDPDVRRVIAQVLSNRGNNALIDSQVIEAQAHLKSEQPTDRQAALNNLAKTHSASAANAIAPLLHDSDINVKLDALLALRATGNQTHVSLVEKLLNDPEPAVSSLASDVASNLKNLSDSARTTVITADIAAELPLMENP